LMDRDRKWRTFGP